MRVKIKFQVVRLRSVNEYCVGFMATKTLTFDSATLAFVSTETFKFAVDFPEDATRYYD